MANVTIHCDTEGAEIRYTVNREGSPENGTLYEAPFTASEGDVIRAIGMKEGMEDSQVAEVTISQMEDEVTIFNKEYEFSNGYVDVDSDVINNLENPNINIIISVIEESNSNNIKFYYATHRQRVSAAGKYYNQIMFSPCVSIDSDSVSAYNGFGDTFRIQSSVISNRITLSGYGSGYVYKIRFCGFV